MGISFKGEKCMNRTVEKGKTILVDGPASVNVLSGLVEVFGFAISNTRRIVIREGKRLPFTVEETATFDISLSETANIEELEGNTIPQSWNKSSEELLSFQTKPVVAIVLGATDSGKTSFCTYIVNRLLNEKKNVAILDGDLGQSDIGPPCTVAYTLPAKPLTDLFNLKAKNASFIGATSPNGATDKVIESLALLKEEALSSNPDFVIVNTDGWFEGEEAVKYKVQLVSKINPNIVFCIQKNNELAPILGTLEKSTMIIVDSPTVVDQRSREKRKNLRELGYVKYLRNAKVQSYPMDWARIEDEFFGLSRTRPDLKKAREIYEALGMKPLHLVEQKDKLSIIIGRSRWINAENLKKAEELMKKKVTIIRKGEEEGLLSALYDVGERFLGIGVLQEIDYLRRTLKILTPVSEEISIIKIGKIKLDKNMKEIPFLEEESPLESAGLNKL